MAATMDRLKPDLCVFVETWLDSTVPDSSVSVNTYFLLRQDREGHGGGIICYMLAL